MKKLLSLALSLVLVLSLASCGPKTDEKTIKVGASPTPHAEILEVAKDILEKDGYTLEIVSYDDYVLPNKALFDGDLDANYFQHTPYLDSFNKDNNMDLVSAGKIHYEPFGLYGNGVTDLKALADGTTIFIPSDDSNETRALFLLAQEGLITLNDDVTIEGGANHLTSIKDNGGYDIQAVEASTVPAQLKNNEGAIAVINGNYAIGAGLKIKDALAQENASGDAAQLYANIIAVNPEDKDSEKIAALLKALEDAAVIEFIDNEYAGAVVSMAK